MDLRGDSTNFFTSCATHDVSLDTYRFMRRLQRASFLLYQSKPFCVVIEQLEVQIFSLFNTYWFETLISSQAEIKSERLRFRGDCNPHVDLGVKQDLLDLLLLTYDPLWLKIGLEVCVHDVYEF